MDAKRTHVSDPYSRNFCTTALYNISSTLGSDPSYRSSVPSLPHTDLARMMFRCTDEQSTFVWSRGLPKYRNIGTFYPLSFTSLPSRLNSIYPQLSTISTYLRWSLLSVSLLNLSD